MTKTPKKKENELDPNTKLEKAALNQYMCSYAIREGGTRPMPLIAPGWIQTELGGSEARYTLEDSIPKLAELILAQKGRKGLRFEDRDGQAVAW